MMRKMTEADAGNLKDEAIEWLIRLGETPETSALQDEFEAWRSQSPAHSAAWEKACLMWAAMGEAPAFYEATPVEARANAAVAPHRRRWGGLVLAGTSAIICIAVVLVVGPAMLLRLEADYRTGTAESREVALPDGSRVELGADSAIASDFSSGVRQVRLLAGEIYLDVAHDGSRPFRVISRDLGVEVLGTAFNVRVDGEGTEIGLERGSVRASASVADHAVDETLAPGDLLAVDRETGKTHRQAVALDAIGAWRTKRLFVTDATIGSVVEQIRRYHPAWIVIADPGFSNLRVTGIFTLSDPDKALLALVAPHGGKVRHVSPYMRLITGF